MRTKFRAWDKVRKEFLSAGQIFLSVEAGRRPKKSFTYLDIISHPDEYKSRFDITQFIELHDKHGAEIYGHDIVLHGYGSKQIPTIVLYQAPSWVMKTRLKTTYWYEFIVVPGQNQFEEVIGNFYENPELLEGKDEND